MGNSEGMGNSDGMGNNEGMGELWLIVMAWM